MSLPWNPVPLSLGIRSSETWRNSSGSATASLPTVMTAAWRMSGIKSIQGIYLRETEPSDWDRFNAGSD